MHRNRLALSLALTLPFALGACGSTRFGSGSLSPSAPAPRQQAYNVPDVAPVEAVPAGSVSSAPLAPPPGVPAASPDPGVGPMIADVPPVAPVQEPTVVASAAPPPLSAPAAPNRSSVVGGWNARDASGSSCKVQLSSSPALDLYRASASGCSNKDLSRVTAWDMRDGEVYLYQPGGAVAARLRSGGGSLDGVLAKSGAPLTLTR